MATMVGKQICLWRAEQKPGEHIIRVVKEVIVTIAEEKIGVPGQYSRTPSRFASYCGLGNDGKIYKKHWDAWPESSQAGDFLFQWTLRADGGGRGRSGPWVPIEAIYLYNSKVSRQMGEMEHFTIVDVFGNEINPKGDVVYCDIHDQYSYVGTECELCRHEHESSMSIYIGI